MSDDATPTPSKLENAFFLTAVAPPVRSAERKTGARTTQDARSAIDPCVVVVGDGTNVVPNHHLGHRAGGGSPPVWYQGGTVRVSSEVTPRA